MSCPMTDADPASGASSVASIRMVVVLPAPFGPSTPYTEPPRTARSTPSTARTSPNLFTRPLASIARGTWIAMRLLRLDGGRKLIARASSDTVVVEAHHRDYVAHVIRILDRAGRPRHLVRSDRVRPDASLVAQLGAQLLGEAEVGRTITVEVADLLPVHPERELAAAPGPCLDARPRRDLVRYLLTGCLCSRHDPDRTTSSAVEVKRLERSSAPSVTSGR